MSSDDGEDANDIISERETQFVPRSDDDEVLWEVQEITAERGRKYKVKWAGSNPATGKSWAQSWVAKHDCTDKLVAEWKAKKKLKSNKAGRGGRTSTTSRASSAVQRTGSSTSGKKTRSSSRRNSAEQEMSPAKTSTTAPGKRKRDPTPVALPTSPRAAVQGDDARPLKKPKVLKALLEPLSSDEDEVLFVSPGEQTKAKSPVKHGVFEPDVEEGSPRKDGKGKSVQHSEALSVSRERSQASRLRMRTEVVIPFRDRVDKDVRASEDERLGLSRSRQKSTAEHHSPSKPDKPLSDAESLHLPIKVGPPRGAKRREKSRESGPSSKPGSLRAKSREDMSSDKRVHAEKPKSHPPLEAPPSGSGGLLSIQRDTTRSRTPVPPPRRISASATSPSVRPHTPELSPGARARLEIFDRMVSEALKPDVAAPAHVSEQVPEVMQFNFDDDGGPMNDPMNDPLDTFNLPHPPSPLPSTSNPKQVKPVTPNGLVVPESETSGNSQSQQGLLKPPAPPLHDGLPTIAVVTTSTSPSSTPPPQNFPLVQKAFSFANRPSKGRVLKPVPQISPNTFRSSIVRSQRPDSAPPSSIESFGTPKRANKGKQRAIEGEVDQLDTSLPEVEEDGRRKGMAQPKATDTELKRKGKELFEEALRKREVERQKKIKAKRLKTVDDIVNGATSSPAKAKVLPPIDEDALPSQWDDVVDLSGGANSATLDTPEQSEAKPLSEEEKVRLRITLRQEEEESTQEAMGIYPSPPQESHVHDVADVPVQPSLPSKDCGQAEDSEQPSADLQLMSVIVEASQEQRQEDTDTEPLLPASSPPRQIPENLTDSPKRRLGGALSLLNVKSEEIERLERELADERKNAQDLSSKFAETRQSLELTNAALVTLDAERAEWSRGRSKLENEVFKLEKQCEELHGEKTNLLGRVDELSLANRQSLESTNAARATFDTERAEWSQERSKWERDMITLEQQREDLHQQKMNLLSRVNELEHAAVRADEMSTKLLELEEERVAWTQERDELLNKLTQRPEPVVDNKISEEYEQDRARWESERASWAEETAKWETEHAALQEKEQTLSRSAEELTARVASVTAAKESADKDKDFFRDQYAQASAFVGSVRDENVELEKRVKIAEGQAQEGVAAIKAMFEGRIKALQTDIDRWKGLTELLQEKDRRTNDEIRRRAAQTPDLMDLCDRLKTENKSLEGDLRKLGQAHQRTTHQRRKLYFEIYTLKKERMTLRSKLSQLVKVTESNTQETSRSAPAPPISQDPEDMDPNDMVTLPDPPTESSLESNENPAWYPCMWRPQWRDQCPHVFDTKEDLERHLQQHYHDLSTAQ